MTRRKAKEPVPGRTATETDQGSYSLWTAPPSSWRSPVTSGASVADLKAKVSQLTVAPAEEDEQTRAFKTPVTPDVLSQPTES